MYDEILDLIIQMHTRKKKVVKTTQTCSLLMSITCWVLLLADAFTAPCIEINHIAMIMLSLIGGAIWISCELANTFLEIDLNRMYFIKDKHESYEHQQEEEQKDV